MTDYNNDTNREINGNKEQIPSLGALWLKKDKNGKEYLCGRVSGISIVVFKNRNKKEARHPDYVIFESTKGQGGGNYD
jgi:hypothetical protein